MLRQEKFCDEVLYRILIVDDEEPIRKGLRYSIDWRELGFRVADEASNAMDAVSLLDNNQYDVLITDIKMPEKTGLDLIQVIKDKHPRTRILIISGYSYFDYAVAAIKLNVDDYILKPIKKEYITERFIRLKNELDREKEEMNRKRTSNRVARNFFLLHLVLDDYKSADIARTTAEKSEIYLPDDDVCIVNVKFKALNRFIDEHFKGDTELFEASVEQKIMPVSDRLFESMLMTYIGNNYVFLIPYEDRDIFVQTLAMYLKGFGCEYQIGVGGRVDNVFLSPVSYHQSIEAIQSSNSAISYFDQDVSGKNQASSLMMLQKQIIDSLESGKYDQLSYLVDEVFFLLEGGNITFIYNWCINSIHEIQEYFEIEKLQKVKVNYFFVLSDKNNYSFSNTMKKSYMEQLSKIVDILKSFSNDHSNELVKNACAMVESRYSDKSFSLYDVVKPSISAMAICVPFSSRLPAKIFPTI